MAKSGIITKEAVDLLERARVLIVGLNKNAFELSLLMHHIKKSKAYKAEFQTFTEFLESVQMSPSLGTKLVKTGMMLEAYNIAQPEQFSYVKFLKALPYLNQDTKAEVLEKVQLKGTEFDAWIDGKKGTVKVAEGDERSTITLKSGNEVIKISLTENQFAVVHEAIERAKEYGSTQDTGTALEYIAADFNSGHLPNNENSESSYGML
jgi:hypothetical protein